MLTTSGPIVAITLALIAALVLTPPSRATTMAIDMNAPAHGSLCVFPDGKYVYLIKWDGDPDASYVSLDDGERATVATIWREHGRRQIDVNGGVASIQAFSHLYEALSALPQIAIPRNGMQAFEAHREGAPQCPWTGMDALYEQVNEEIARGVAHSNRR